MLLAVNDLLISQSTLEHENNPCLAIADGIQGEAIFSYAKNNEK